MGRPKRLYPLGRYRLHVRGEIDPAKQYLVQLEYTWNRQVIRKGMNIFVRLGDWNEKANKGRGGVRASYGPEANRINSLLLARVDKIDSLLAEFQQKKHFLFREIEQSILRICVTISPQVLVMSFFVCCINMEY